MDADVSSFAVTLCDSATGGVLVGVSGAPVVNALTFTVVMDVDTRFPAPTTVNWKVSVVLSSPSLNWEAIGASKSSFWRFRIFDFYCRISPYLFPTETSLIISIQRTASIQQHICRSCINTLR